MLKIATQKNYLQKDSSKNQFCFRSIVSQVLTTEDLVQEIINYNSTITEVDANAVMTVLGTLVPRFTAKGYIVELPFCNVYTKASGTCSSIRDSFSAGTGDNKIESVIELTEKADKRIVENAVYEIVSSSYVCDPRINEIWAILDDSSLSSDLNISAGAQLHIYGNNLSMDLSDEKQGIFFVKGEVSVRAVRYSRAGSNVID